jgi:hypothetical protein
MSKTPEELADQHVKKLWEHTGTELQRICSKQDFLAGYHSRYEEVAKLKAELQELKND